MSSSPPTTLGKYQIIREIARSNDIVYEAYDPLMNRRVAIKELSMPAGANAGQKDDRIKRFLREARAVGSLTHPNIMTVFEVGQDGDRHFIAMEYLDGHTLRNELDTKGFLPPDDAVDLAKKVLSGLEYAHSKGVIHRDIKPDNIQILSDGRIKLTDFGIARLTFEPNLTMDGQVFGTPSYMSPEQVVGRDIDARSDLFSVGVVLYEMIAGQKPFAGDSVVSITYAIMNKEPDRPSQANFALWQVIEKSLDKSPQLRYPNAKEMMEALDSAQKAVQPGSMVIDPGRPQIGGTLYQPGPGYFAAPTHGGYPHQTQGPYLQHPANPYQQQPAPPPVVYPYNPYQQPGVMHQGTILPGADPNSMPGYTQAPIYYPPPPRKPLLKPETKYFIGRLFLVVTGLVLLFGLILVVEMAATRVASPTKQAAIPASGTEDDPVRRAQAEVDSTISPAERSAKQKLLAATLEKQGLDQMERGAEAEGEQSLSNALANDPTRTASAIALAGYYERQAESAKDPNARIQWLQAAADSWAKAADADIDPEQLLEHKTKAASSFLDLAGALADTNQRDEARKALFRGRQYAPPGSAELSQVAAMIKKLS